MCVTVNDALKRCFADKRIVFWYDEGGKCRAEFDEAEVEGVEKLVINGNEFGIKYKILAEKPKGKFLVYSPKAQPTPAEDWLYDLYLAGASFSTDPVSMVMSEMGFPEKARGVVTEKMLPFFKSEQRKRDVKNLLAALERRPSAEEIELALMCAVCRVRDHLKIEHVLAVLLKELSENKADRIDELSKYGLEPALWKRLGIDYGYQNATNPSVVDFANKLFHDAFYPAVRDACRPVLVAPETKDYVDAVAYSNKVVEKIAKLASAVASARRGEQQPKESIYGRSNQSET